MAVPLGGTPFFSMRLISLFVSGKAVGDVTQTVGGILTGRSSQLPVIVFHTFPLGALPLDLWNGGVG